MRNMVVRKRQNVSIIFRKTGFQHSSHILSLKVCFHSTNDLTNKQTKKRLHRKERDEEGKRTRKGEKKLLLIGSQHLDEGITVKKGMNLDELFIYWSLKLRGKSNTLLP